MHIHRAAFRLKGVAPDLIEQFFPGKNYTGLLHQNAEQFEFLVGQRDFLFVYQHLMAGGEQLNCTHLILIRGGTGFGTAQQSVYPGTSSIIPKGFGM